MKKFLTFWKKLFPSSKQEQLNKDCCTEQVGEQVDWKAKELLITDPFEKGLLYEELLGDEVCCVNYTPCMTDIGIIYELTMTIPISKGSTVSKAKLLGRFPISENKEKVAFLEKITTDPAFQGKGYGTLLLSVYLKHLESMGIEKVMFSKVRYNERLARFYKKFGFHINHKKLTLNIATS